MMEKRNATVQPRPRGNAAANLKRCNRWLGITLLLTLISGIQLEATSGRYAWTVWLHIALGIILTILSLYHIHLHYRSGNWFARFARNRNIVTKILWWVFLLTAITGIAASIMWADGFSHTHLGAVHGKIGFLMVVLGIIHAVRHKGTRKRRASLD